MSRPTASLVVPFAGPPVELASLIDRLSGLVLRDGDEIVVVDNGPVATLPPAPARVSVLRAGEYASSYGARNAGASLASGQWLVFCDADTEPVPALLDAYFDPVPGERTGILAGGVHDHAEGGSLAARLARETAAMSQEASLANPHMPYAITANCAFRAEAFRQAGGFEPHIRSGGDADLCWRLQGLGWGLEQRPAASVEHRNRAALRALWRQRARHGAGAAWLDRRYPGAMPPWGLAALARDSLLRVGGGLAGLARGDVERARLAVATVSGWWAFEIGRRASNRARPL